MNVAFTATRRSETDLPWARHLDLRYLVVAPLGAAFSRSADETRDMRWVEWEEAASLARRAPDFGPGPFSLEPPRTAGD